MTPRQVYEAKVLRTIKGSEALYLLQEQQHLPELFEELGRCDLTQVSVPELELNIHFEQRRGHRMVGSVRFDSTNIMIVRYSRADDLQSPDIYHLVTNQQAHAEMIEKIRSRLKSDDVDLDVDIPEFDLLRGEVALDPELVLEPVQELAQE